MIFRPICSIKYKFVPSAKQRLKTMMLPSLVRLRNTTLMVQLKNILGSVLIKTSKIIVLTNNKIIAC